jgi:ATP-dependent DNA ligase
VVWRAGRLDFDALQRRLSTRGPALERLVRTAPAAFAAFDLLAVAGRDVRAHPLRVRRALLEELATGWTGALQLSPASTERAQAEEWFAVLAEIGVEGVVVKGRDQPYAGGRRSWVKVKHRDTVELVCAAVIGPMTAPERLVLGRPDGAALPIVARSTPLHGAVARRLGEQLRPPRGPHPWPTEIPPSSFSGSDAPVRLTLVEPIVVEVAADVALTGRTYRHPVRYVRTRPELTPAELPPAASAG